MSGRITQRRRAIPVSVKAAVDPRSRRRGPENQRIIPCEVCDCNAGPVLEYHHVRPFEHGGAHSPRNIIKLCPTCHAVVSRDRTRWALWPKNGFYDKPTARRLALLADIQHDPFCLFGFGATSREEAWQWLQELCGFTPDDIPQGASWGERWRKEAKEFA